MRLDDEDLARGGPAGLDGAIAMAALTLLSPDAADRLPRSAPPCPPEARCAPPPRPGTGG
jgi:hypothetical protein